MLRIVASDVVPYAHCARRLWYDHNPPPGEMVAPDDPFDLLIAEMGLAHEQRVLEQLSATNEVVEARSAQHTAELMAGGAPIIFQAELFDDADDLFGKPDFLIRQDDGHYQAADAKLARSVDKEIGIQLAFYRRLLGNDHPGLVFLGNGDLGEVGLDHNKHLNQFIAEARNVLGTPDRPEVRYSASKCGACPYNDVCYPGFQEKDELSLLYGVDGRSVHHLEAAGIETIDDLAAADPNAVPNVPYLKDDKKHRAVLQAQAWKSGEIIQRNPVTLPQGTWVHFDIEVNPLTSDGAEHVYLWGFLEPPYTAESFEYIWTDSEADDRLGWDLFLDRMEQYRRKWPDLRLIHFSNYERGKIKQYAARYEMEDHPIVVWLLDEHQTPLYDIQDAVTDNLVLPLPGYGLKAICKHPDLVNFQWEDDASGSQWSVVQYVRYLQESDPAAKDALKAAILGYNRDDVTATRKLEEWLRNFP